MRSNTRNRLFPVLGVAFLGVIAFALVKVVRSQEPGSDNALSVVQAVRNGGLREAARIKKQYVIGINTSQWLKYDLESLTKNSAEIVVGSPVSSVSHLTADGESIATTYQVKVLQSMRGGLAPSETIDVSLPGGQVFFEDGTSAEIKTLDLERMESGKTYVLFLGRNKDVSSSFTLTGGGQGLFELPEDKSGVKPLGHHADFVQKHENERQEEFLEEIRAAVIKYPRPSSCCNK